MGKEEGKEGRKSGREGRDSQGLVDTPHVRNPEKYPEYWIFKFVVADWVETTNVLISSKLAKRGFGDIAIFRF